MVIYTFLNVYAPYCSAGVIDNLFSAIRSTVKNGTGFKIGWNKLGVGMFSLSAMYILLALFYHFQGYLMASVAEKLILTLCEKISRKLNKLPLSFFDGNKA